MISFDLKCGNGHVFEAWFGSSADYDDQNARGLVTCPICADAHIGKALMAPAIRPGEGSTPADAKAMLARLARMQARLEQECDYVGDRFADEARRRHAQHAKGDEKGKVADSKAAPPKRGIIGRTSPGEARELLEEGIPIAPLPFRLRRDSDA